MIFQECLETYHTEERGTIAKAVNSTHIMLTT